MLTIHELLSWIVIYEQQLHDMVILVQHLQIHMDIYINGETYYPYDILEAMDSSNLEDLRARYCRESNDEDRDNAEYELERADDGDHVEIQGYTVEVREEDNFAAGDTDGDEELPFAEGLFREPTKDVKTAIEEVRQKIALKKEEENKAKIEEKATEDDIMKLFQVM